MPLRHSKGDFKRQKDIFVLKLDNRRVRFVIFCCEFCGQNFVECRAFFSHRAIVPKTKGVNTPCSISMTLLLYTLFFSFSRRSKVDSVNLSVSICLSQFESLCSMLTWLCLNRSCFVLFNSSSRSARYWLGSVSNFQSSCLKTLNLSCFVFNTRLVLFAGFS